MRPLAAGATSPLTGKCTSGVGLGGQSLTVTGWDEEKRGPALDARWGVVHQIKREQQVGLGLRSEHVELGDVRDFHVLGNGVVSGQHDGSLVMRE
jgi:hypothetical protein